ncbi:MAG: division/cell wall cluster transcriptional repressor MraZ [Actinomycetota bacterium]
MLLGEFRHTLDAKGRVFLPARWREELGEKVVLTLGLDGCLYLMTTESFKEMAERFQRWPHEDERARRYTRLFFAKASEETVDAQGRITIPAPLRQAAGLGKELVLTGAADRAEVWDRSSYDSYSGEAQERYEELAKELR